MDGTDGTTKIGPSDPPQEGPTGLGWSKYRDLTPDCGDIDCRQIDGKCVGWHCPRCGKGTGPQGHDCPELLPVVNDDGRTIGRCTEIRAGYDGLYVTMRIEDEQAAAYLRGEGAIDFTLRAC